MILLVCTEKSYFCLVIWNSINVKTTNAPTELKSLNYCLFSVCWVLFAIKFVEKGKHILTQVLDVTYLHKVAYLIDRKYVVRFQIFGAFEVISSYVFTQSPVLILRVQSDKSFLRASLIQRRGAFSRRAIYPKNVGIFGCVSVAVWVNGVSFPPYGTPIAASPSGGLPLKCKKVKHKRYISVWHVRSL